MCVWPFSLPLVLSRRSGRAVGDGAGEHHAQSMGILAHDFRYHDDWPRAAMRRPHHQLHTMHEVFTAIAPTDAGVYPPADDRQVVHVVEFDRVIEETDSRRMEVMRQRRIDLGKSRRASLKLFLGGGREFEGVCVLVQQNLHADGELQQLLHEPLRPFGLAEEIIPRMEQRRSEVADLCGFSPEDGEFVGRVLLEHGQPQLVEAACTAGGLDRCSIAYVTQRRHFFAA